MRERSSLIDSYLALHSLWAILDENRSRIHCDPPSINLSPKLLTCDTTKLVMIWFIYVSNSTTIEVQPPCLLGSFSPRASDRNSTMPMLIKNYMFDLSAWVRIIRILKALLTLASVLFLTIIGPFRYPWMVWYSQYQKDFSPIPTLQVISCFIIVSRNASLLGIFNIWRKLSAMYYSVSLSPS